MARRSGFRILAASAMLVASPVLHGVGWAQEDPPTVPNDRASSKTTAAPKKAAEPPHLLGDWNGLRPWLDKLGIEYNFDYTTESVANVAGGRRLGAAYAHQVGMAVDVDWEKLAGITGFSTHVTVIDRAGRNASADYVGDTVLQAQEIYGAGFHQFAKLVWFYGEERLFDDRVAFAFGRFAPGLDFQASSLYCNFMTLTICGHDRALTANQGFEDWPMNEFGGRLKVKPIDPFYVMVGAFQSQPFPTDAEPYTQGGHTGLDWTLKGTTGVSFPVELGYEPKFGPDALPGHYKIGYDYDTSAYRISSSTSTTCRSP